MSNAKSNSIATTFKLSLVNLVSFAKHNSVISRSTYKTVKLSLSSPGVRIPWVGGSTEVRSVRVQLFYDMRWTVQLSLAASITSAATQTREYGWCRWRRCAQPSRCWCSWRSVGPVALIGSAGSWEGWHTPNLLRLLFWKAEMKGRSSFYHCCISGNLRINRYVRMVLAVKGMPNKRAM